MVAIQIPEDLAAHIEEGAQLTGKPYAEFLREAVLSRLEDLEDIVIATERLNNPGKRYTLAQVVENLGLDD